MNRGGDVSVVLPAYNEADTIEHTVRRTLSSLEGFLPEGTFEVIVAEDGCDDRTPEIAARLARDDPRVRHIHSNGRLGRGSALERAFRASSGGTLVYFDTDLATDLRHLEELVRRVRDGDADVVTGSRLVPGHEASRPLKRGIPSRLYNGLVRLFFRSTVRDHQCGFKAFDRRVLLSLLDDIEDDHWFWDTELLVRAQRDGYHVEEFPVRWTPQGDTKVDLFRDVLGMGSQILRTWWQLSVEPRITPRRAIAGGFVLTVAAIALMGLYLPYGRVIGEILNANPLLIGLAGVAYALSWPLRGKRYGDILGELGHRGGVGFLTGAIFISQTGNLVFPARAGDAIRAYIVKAGLDIPYPTGAASLAIERLFDLLTITLLACIVLIGLGASGGVSYGTLLASLTGIEGGHGGIIRSGRTALYVAGGVGLATVLLVGAIVASARSDRTVVRNVVFRMSSDSYATTIVRALERFAGDVQTVPSRPAAFGKVGASSVVIWTIDVATALVVLAAFDVNLPLVTLVSVGFFAVSVGNLAKVLPLSPGGIGLYEGAFTLLIVGLTPVGWAPALGAAIVDHAVKNLVTVGGGLASTVFLKVSLTNAVLETRNIEPAMGD